MKNKVKVVFAFYFLFISSCVFAKENSHSHNDSHASHVYGPVDDVSTSEVLADFMVAPTSMTMKMHMFGLMYGVNEKFMKIYYRIRRYR